MKWIITAVGIAKKVLGKSKELIARKAVESKQNASNPTPSKQTHSFGRKDIEKKADLANNTPDEKDFKRGREVAKSNQQEKEKEKEKSKNPSSKEKKSTKEKEKRNSPSKKTSVTKKESKYLDYYPRYLPPELPDTEQEYGKSDDKGMSL
jgi:26S proteasome regulatory complex component